MGARDKGVRVTVVLEDKPGELARITKAIADTGGNFISFGFFASEEVSTKILTFKVEGIKRDDFGKGLNNMVKSSGMFVKTKSQSC